MFNLFYCFFVCFLGSWEQNSCISEKSAGKVKENITKREHTVLCARLQWGHVQYQRSSSGYHTLLSKRYEAR